MTLTSSFTSSFCELLPKPCLLSVSFTSTRYSLSSFQFDYLCTYLHVCWFLFRCSLVSTRVCFNFQLKPNYDNYGNRCTGCENETLETRHDKPVTANVWPARFATSGGRHSDDVIWMIPNHEHQSSRTSRKVRPSHPLLQIDASPLSLAPRLTVNYIPASLWWLVCYHTILQRCMSTWHRRLAEILLTAIGTMHADGLRSLAALFISG